MNNTIHYESSPSVIQQSDGTLQIDHLPCSSKKYIENDIDLDTSWIQDVSRLHRVNDLMEREEMNCISIQTIYINSKQEIEKTEKETIELRKINSTQKYKIGITNEQLLHFIQKKKNTLFTKKYKLDNVLLYNIDIEPTHIHKYVNENYTDNTTLVSVPIVKDIVIPPSLLIFHSIQTLYCIFIECQPVLKSILKNGNDSGNKSTKHTKKVKIMDKPTTIKKTAKNMAATV
jgi:hypothetical protein